MCDFMQTQLKQKINSHNAYQTLLDKKLRTNFEKKISFSKSKITTKNEIIEKLLNNDIRGNKLQYGE